jgi:hypothetical protein
MRTMTESDARRIVLVRAFETPDTLPWTGADAAWASAETRREVGEAADAGAFLSRRADLAMQRLASREPAAARVWQAAGGHAMLGLSVLLIAFVAGLAGNAVGAAQRINILAPPLLALLVWNLAVYAGTLVSALRRRSPGPAAGPLRGLLLRCTERLAAFTARPASKSAPAFARFLLDWARLSRSLQGARIAAVLHAAAAALALGALLSLYVRGLAFEYRAGWESTFLAPGSVHGLVAFVLGPASRWSGIALPGVAEIAALRGPGGGGENAARWIHLYAITLSAFVVLPRLALAAGAAWRAHRLARDFMLPLDGAYTRRVLRAHGAALAVRVLPYSYHLSDDARPALREALEAAFDQGVEPTFAEPVPQGGEEDLAAWWPTPPPVAVAALFALTATPEHENHGVFLRALAQALPDAERLRVLVDESGFRRRFADPKRLAERRDAWRRMLHDEGLEALFVDLAPVAMASAS